MSSFVVELFNLAGGLVWVISGLKAFRLDLEESVALVDWSSGIGNCGVTNSDHSSFIPLPQAIYCKRFLRSTSGLPRASGGPGVSP
jgi:hypothetical protein